MFFLWVFGIAASALVLSLFAERMLWTLVIVFLLTVVLPGSALVVRRLHDIGHFGWWSLLCLIPYLGLIVIALCALPGQSGSNRYGQPITDLGDVG